MYRSLICRNTQQVLVLACLQHLGSAVLCPSQHAQLQQQCQCCEAFFKPPATALCTSQSSAAINSKLSVLACLQHSRSAMLRLGLSQNAQLQQQQLTNLSPTYTCTRFAMKDTWVTVIQTMVVESWRRCDRKMKLCSSECQLKSMIVKD